MHMHAAQYVNLYVFLNVSLPSLPLPSLSVVSLFSCDMSVLMKEAVCELMSLMVFRSLTGDPLYRTLPPRAGNAQPCVITACTPTVAADNDIISSFPGWTRPVLEGGVVHVQLWSTLTPKGCRIRGFSTQLFQDFLFPLILTRVSKH